MCDSILRIQIQFLKYNLFYSRLNNIYNIDMNKTCSGSNKLCEKIRKYILNTEEYHLTEADKNNILVSILKCTWLWNFLLSNPGVKYKDL